MDDDQQAEIRNKMLGFIFQQYNLIPKLTVLENVELPLLYAGVPSAERRERAVRALGRVGLESRPAAAGLHCPGSGGEPFGDSGRRAHRRPGLPHRPGGAGFPQEAQPGGGHSGPHHPRQLYRGEGRPDHPPSGRENHLRRGRPRPPGGGPARRVVQPGEAGEENEEQEVGA